MLKASVGLVTRTVGQVGLFTRCNRGYASTSKITLVTTNSSTGQSEPGPFLAVIETQPAIKEELKASLIAKGLMCMDYSGDANKIAVGFGVVNFIHLMTTAIHEVEQPASQANDHTPRGGC